MAGPALAWSWSAGGGWKSPDNPRLTFARSRALYKLYLIREMSAPDERIEGDPSLEFVQAFFPELERALFAGS